MKFELLVSQFEIMAVQPRPSVTGALAAASSRAARHEGVERARAVLRGPAAAPSVDDKEARLPEQCSRVGGGRILLRVRAHVRARAVTSISLNSVLLAAATVVG